jgi:dTDP-4-dehydrorhamnose 3,5-epimerase-like enzyme
MSSSQDISFISGGLAVDDRGCLTFCNDFDMQAAGIRRFYLVSNHEARFVRAWHAHKIEIKYVVALSGAAVVAAVKVDDWKKPRTDLDVKKFVISAEKPGLLRIPGGFAHGTMTLTEGTKLMFLSSSTLEESAKDDFRYQAFYWNPWAIIPR